MYIILNNFLNPIFDKLSIVHSNLLEKLFEEIIYYNINQSLWKHLILIFHLIKSQIMDET